MKHFEAPYYLYIKFEIFYVCMYICLFVLSHLDVTNCGAYGGVLGTIGNPTERRGAMAWFHNVWTQYERVFEFEVIYGMEKSYR